MDADDIREMFAVSLLKTMNAGETPGTFCSPGASNVQVRMKSGLVEQKMDNRLTEHRFTSRDGGAVARDRPSRLQAEEAVRTLIYWAGDDSTREVNVRAVAIAVLAKPDRLARPPQPQPPSRRRPPNRSGQKEFGKKKSAAARPKARAGSAAALARARKSPKAG